MTDTTPPAGQTALRDRIIEALLAPRYGGPQHNNPGGLRLTATPEEARRHRAGQIADIVLAVLPPPASQADEVHRLAMSEALDLGTGAPWDAIHERVKELRRMADEAQPAKRRCTCSHPADEHSVYGCADGCACEWMPKRKPPMDPVHILGIKADEEQTGTEVVPCVRSDTHPAHLHSGLRKGAAVHGKCPGVPTPGAQQ